MKRTILLLVAVTAASLAIGCNNSSGTTNVVTIRDFSFSPFQVNVRSGTVVQWINQGNATHSVVSGTLIPGSHATTNVSVVPSGFSTLALSIVFGGSILFTNTTALTAQIKVVDQFGNVVFQGPQFPPTTTSVWQPATTGVFTVTNNLVVGNSLVVTVTGVPVPDGRFRSPNIPPNATFQFAFTTPGTYTYFCGVHDAETGVITVSP